MTNLIRTPVILLCLLFAGCAAHLPANKSAVMPPQSQYDSIIADSDGALLSINQLAEQLASADVVVIGEYHGHHGAHLLQALIQSTLYRIRPQQLLSMEQFTLADQSELNRYLDGQTGEEELIADTGAWSNYRASYRPLIEFSKNHNIAVIAANAPTDIVRCIGRNGEDYLNQLDSDQREQLPADPFVDTPAYRNKFFDVIGGGHSSNHSSSHSSDQSQAENQNSKRMENSYKAQLLRDNTMADQVFRALQKNPDHQVIHLNGTFHSENRLGMVAVLEKQHPGLEVAVLSPVFWSPDDDFNSLLEAHRGKGDFLYFLQPLPEEYKDSERHREAIMQKFRNAAELTCG